MNLNSIPLDTYIFDTGSAQSFSQGVSVTIPLVIPTAIRTAQYNFVVMSGTIATGNFQPTSESIPMTVDSNGDLSVTITKPGIYRIYVNLGLSTTDSTGPLFNIGRTACGAGATYTVSSPTAPAVGSIISFLSVLPPATTLTTSITIDAITNVQTVVSGQYNYIQYRVLSTTGSVLEQYLYPLPQVKILTAPTNCHNSGGS
jgi:hypothetical protein